MRVGSICYATEQGLGYLAKDFYWHGVIDNFCIFKHLNQERETHTEWYPVDTPILSNRPFARYHKKELQEFVKRIDICLFFESPMDWQVLRYIKDQGKKSALVTMYEWFPENPPDKFDLYLCPSRLDEEVFNKKYPGKSKFLSIPASTEHGWHKRDKALKFLHNAGHIGSRNHKGTLELMRAMEHVKTDMQLTIRCQDKLGIERLIKTVPGIECNPKVHFEKGSIKRQDLFTKEYDVYIAPEKYNGLSLPLQEAFANGMCVITTNMFPHNAWLPREPLIDPVELCRIRIHSSYLEVVEAIHCPQEIAKKIDEIFNTDISKYSDMGFQWYMDNSWHKLRPKYLEALRSVL